MKKIVTILIAIAMIAMIGTAVADPSKIDIDTTTIANPLFHPLDGSMVSYSVEITEMRLNTSSTTRYMELTNVGLGTVRLHGNGVDITTGPGVTGMQWTVPANTASQTFTLEITTTTIGTVAVDNSLGSSIPSDSISRTAADFGGAANDFAIPEFPTIALPIAAILGLAFIFQRRREED